MGSSPIFRREIKKRFGSKEPDLFFGFLRKPRTHGFKVSRALPLANSLGRFAGKKVHRTFFLIPLTPSSAYSEKRLKGSFLLYAEDGPAKPDRGRFRTKCESDRNSEGVLCSTSHRRPREARVVAVMLLALALSGAIASGSSVRESLERHRLCFLYRTRSLQT